MKKTTKKLVLKKETVAMLIQVTGGATALCTRFCTTACTDSCPCSGQYAC